MWGPSIGYKQTRDIKRLWFNSSNLVLYKGLSWKRGFMLVICSFRPCLVGKDFFQRRYWLWNLGFLRDILCEVLKVWSFHSDNFGNFYYRKRFNCNPIRAIYDMDCIKQRLVMQFIGLSFVYFVKYNDTIKCHYSLPCSNFMKMFLWIELNDPFFYEFLLLWYFVIIYLYLIFSLSWNLIDIKEIFVWKFTNTW